MFVISNNFIKDIIKNASEQIKYKNTVTTGEITVDNGDGTYDVKIANANSAYPNVETINYDAVFSVGEIVDIIFEQGCKEAPKIIGHSKKIKQEPKKVEVDYSGETGGGKQTETVIIYSNANDGCISNSDNNYLLSHNNNGSGEYILITDSGEGGNIIGIGQNFAIDYIIKKGFLFFDTSIIPSDAAIISAILNIYAESLPDTNFNIVIQDGQPNYPHSPLIDSDYYYGNYFNNGGQITTVGISLIAYTNIILNSNGRNWIYKGGITKLCLRSSKDIALVAPIDWEFIYFYSSEKGGDYRPKLTITYEI